MFYVYLLQHSETDELYIGFTTDLRRRIAGHNAKGKKFTTRKSGKWYLRYYEAYSSEEYAKERERKLKQHGSGKQKLIKRLQKSIV